MVAVEMSLAASLFLVPAPQSESANVALSGCQPHVQLRSAAAYAKDVGAPKSGTADHHTIKLWSSLSNDRWKTGEMLPGHRAVIRAQDEFGFLVVTSEGARGWVSRFQVSHTLRQDARSERPCEEPIAQHGAVR